MTKTRYEKLLHFQALEAAAEGAMETKENCTEKNNNANSKSTITDDVENLNHNLTNEPTLNKVQEIVNEPENSLSVHETESIIQSSNDDGVTVSAWCACSDR